MYYVVRDLEGVELPFEVSHTVASVLAFWILVCMYVCMYTACGSC